jgi:HAD superfamily hydrolase (TIGR01490 family)
VTVAFFDLDRTLIDVNSGHAWVAAEWRAGRMTTRTVLWSLGLFARYALGADDLDAAIDAAAAQYRGVSVDELRARVTTWFDTDVRRRLRPGATAALAAHRAAGDALVVATTSSQFAAAAAAAAFGLDDIVCTEVGHDGQTLDGTVRRSAFGAHKLTACATWAASHGHALADAAFYTDSYSDLPLLEAVGRPFVVHPDRRLARAATARGWPVLDWSAA